MIHRTRTRRTRSTRWKVTPDVLTDMLAGPSAYPNATFASEDERREAYFALRDVLAETGACQAFWQYEGGIPDDLRIEMPGPNPWTGDWETALVAWNAHELRRQRFLESRGYPEADHGRVRPWYLGHGR